MAEKRFQQAEYECRSRWQRYQIEILQTRPTDGVYVLKSLAQTPTLTCSKESNNDYLHTRVLVIFQIRSWKMQLRLELIRKSDRK